MRLLLGALVLFAAAACGSTDGVAAPTTTSAPPATTATATTIMTPPSTTPPTTTTLPAGCGSAVEAGTTTIEIGTPDGLTRSATQHVPTGYDPDAATPLVLSFHGFGFSGPAHHVSTGLTAVADRETFIVVTPQGSVAPVFQQTFWNTESPQPPAGLEGELVDDVGFTELLIDDLSSRLCIDVDRVHATGLSNGGFFSSRLACDLSSRIASVATVAGVFDPPGCAQDRAVPILTIHGTGDPVVPFDASPSNLGDVLALDDDAVFALLVGQREPVPQIIDRWAAANGCAIEVITTEISDTVERRDYEGCDAATAFVIVTGGGHTWPGTPAQFEAIVGTTDQTFRASDMIWDWFAGHPRVVA